MEQQVKNRIVRFFENGLDVLLLVAAAVQVYVMEVHPDMVLSAESMAQVAAFGSAARLIIRRMIVDAVDLASSRDEPNVIDVTPSDSAKTGKFDSPPLPVDDMDDPSSDDSGVLEA